LSPVRHAVFANVEGTKEPCGNSNVLMGQAPA